VVASFLVGLFLGFVMSIPPGPISIAVIKQGVQGNFRRGIRIGFGAAIMDSVYALIAAFASSAIVVRLAKFINGQPWMELAFQVVCIAILILLGRKYVRATTDDLRHSTEEEEEQETRVKKFGYSSAVMFGVLMGIMNLANPSFLPSLMAASGFVSAKGWILSGVAGSALFAVGFATGVFCWFYVLLRIILRVRTNLPMTYFTYIFRFAGIAFYVFAVILAVRVFLATEWKSLV